MINKDLLFFIMKWPRDIKMKPGPRAMKHPGDMTACLLDEGVAHEFYSPDGKKKIVSWFWRSKTIMIPTSPYSNLRVSDDAKFTPVCYGDMFRNLKANEEQREYYRLVREEHNEAIAERIHDLKTLSPVENYAKLLETKPWVFEHFNEELIASYLNISIQSLKKFTMNKA
jgi:hypothetical protein